MNVDAPASSSAAAPAPASHGDFLAELRSCADVFERNGARSDIHVREARLVLRLLGDDVTDPADLDACIACVDTRGGGRLTLPQFVDLVHLRAAPRDGTAPIPVPEDDLSRAWRRLVRGGEEGGAEHVPVADLRGLLVRGDPAAGGDAGDRLTDADWDDLWEEADFPPPGPTDRLTWEEFRRLFLPPLVPD